ncbi:MULTISPECIES: ROK family protein [Clostridium]|uniref:ROK family protein n=1 Tax=Clostridium TaxID=1485 RepID=UPI001FAA5954|nr:ROK family protein [Clostridium sp. HBUAS56017]
MLKNFESLNIRCKNIFGVVQKNGPITKSKLIDITKIKLTTLNRDLKILIDEKIIVETDIGESTGGRKPSLYDVNTEKFYIVGIDISRTYTRIVITNLKLEIIGEETLNHDYNIENSNDIILTSLKILFRKLHVKESELLGIGIGIVGGFNINPLYKRLKEEFNVSICIDNGANTAVIGEYYFGSGKGKNNIVYINCGVGIRTGIISSGVLIRAINNLEDVFGHMVVDVNGELCSCGNHGCIESYVSIPYIIKKFKDESKVNDDIGYRDICRLSEEGNKVATNIIKKSALYFGIGLSNYIKLFNPELIILSGPLIQNSRVFYEECRKVAVEKCHVKNENIIFARGGLYEDKSIAIGACVMVIQKMEGR